MHPNYIMTSAILAIIGIMLLVAPTDADIATCEKHQSHETCLHELLP